MLAVVVAGFIRVGVCPACLFLWEWDNNKQQQHNMKNENMNNEHGRETGLFLCGGGLERPTKLTDRRLAQADFKSRLAEKNGISMSLQL